MDAYTRPAVILKKREYEAASSRTDGCGSSAVCGLFAAELSRRKIPDEILEIPGESILLKTGRLPKEDEHCVFLAAALQEGLNDYMVKQKR